MAALVADAQEEGPERSGRLRGRPGGLDQHGAGIGTPMFADPAILRQAKTGLAHTRIEAEVAHQPLRLAEPPESQTAAMIPLATMALTPVIV